LEVEALRQQLAEAKVAEEEVSRLREQLAREKQDFSNHLGQIERLVEQMSKREGDLNSQVAELNAEKGRLESRLAETRSRSDLSARSDSSRPRLSSCSSECSTRQSAQPQDDADRAMAEVLLQSQVDSAERKLKMADMENAMLRRQLMMLRKMHASGGATGTRSKGCDDGSVDAQSS